MAYQMGWVDENGEPAMTGEARHERIHGQFALCVAAALETPAENAIDYALSIELAQNAALMHEDVEDGNTDRSGRPTVWWTWGPAQAINAGDGMQAMARLSLFSILDGAGSPESVSGAIEALDDAVLSRCEGEYLDIAYQERLTLTPAQYLEMAEGRSGSLFGGAGVLGAIAAGVDEKSTLHAVRDFGRKVGAARQVNQDVESLWGERDLSSQGRLISKKKNLAIVYSIEHGDATLRRKLGELYMQRVLDPAMIGEVAKLADSAGGRDFCQQTVAGLVDEAHRALFAAGVDGEQHEQLMRCAAAITTDARGPG
jgi:geranylgeranyl diphosphate synthase type I